LEISSSFQQWNNFENRLRFEKIIAKSLVASCFGTQRIDSVLQRRVDETEVKQLLQCDDDK